MLPSAVKPSPNLAFLFDLTESPILKCLPKLPSAQTELLVQTSRQSLDALNSGVILSPASCSRSRQCKKNGILPRGTLHHQREKQIEAQSPHDCGVTCRKGNQGKLSYV